MLWFFMPITQQQLCRNVTFADLWKKSLARQFLNIFFGPPKTFVGKRWKNNAEP